VAEAHLHGQTSSGPRRPTLSTEAAAGAVSQPLRGADARSAQAARHVARRRQAQPNGWWGMVLFLCAETTLFGGLIATYFYLDFGTGRWPPPGVSRPSVLAPLILTAILLSTSVPMALAARSAQAGARRWCALAVALAVVVQCGYVAYQLHLFVGEVHRFPPQGSAYASIYFTLLATHDAHVILGILFNAGLLLWLASAELTNYRLTGVRAVALYWHVVNALAVAVVLTGLSPSL
jgi:heme/copper-type cytochrome/quinol oxidase subunit 3